MTEEQVELERRLDAGDWLSTTEVATLFGVSRGTAHAWLESGRISWRRHGLRNRRADPADVRRLLDESRHVHGGDSPAPST